MERAAPFDPTEGLQQIGALARLTSTPAGHEEICSQGLALVAAAVGAAGALFLVPSASAQGHTCACHCGAEPVADLRRLGERAIAVGEAIEEGPPGRPPARVAVLLPGDTGPLGALVLGRPARWNGAARLFAQAAARTLAAALRAADTIATGREQGEELARRNVEIEALHELAVRFQGLDRDEEVLQAALDLVLEKMALQSGWIFWGQAGSGRLELAASRGIADEFIARARTSGIGDCLCQDVFSTGRLRYARNTVECPRLPELVYGSGPQSHASIPLKFERGVLGVMNIASRPGRMFTPEELTFLETVGKQICLTVDKARSGRAETRRDAEARALASLSRAIGGSLDLDRVLGSVGEYVRRLLSVDRCAIFLGDGSAPLHFAYLSGPPMVGLEVGRPADFTAIGSRALPEALRQRRPLVVDDARSDPNSNATLAARWSIASALLVPLLARDRQQGVLVATRERASRWSREEVELADALAGQAALALENAQLYREAREAFLGLQQAQYGMMRAERMAAVGTLAASLAHEVRNPLNSISLQLVLLSRRLARQGAAPAEDLAPLVEAARKEIERLDELVEEFLSLSTLDRLTLTEAHPEEIVREVLGLMTPAAQQRGVRMIEDLAGDLPALRLDREKLKQVLINLVRNAIEAMPGGGTLTLRTRAGDGAATVSVIDTGVGIEPGLDVFDFFITTKRGGTGLGLPIARRIVEGHGGSLTYDSRPGEGTTFRVSLKIP